MGIIKSFALFLFLLMSWAANAQTDLSTVPIEKIDGIKYYIHQVKQGETLYAISKFYGVSVGVVSKHNPGSDQGIQVLQLLKIPVDEVNKELAATAPKLVDGNLLHTVQKKETLFGITRQYNVQVSDLLQANDSSIYQLREGQQLIIPMEGVSTTLDKAKIPAKPDSLIIHEVQPKETLYSLARLYNVNIDSIRIVNNGLTDGLKVGSLIRIPKLDPELNKKAPLSIIPQLPNEVKRDSQAIKAKYKVALMLPLYIKENDSLANLVDSIKGYYPKPYQRSDLALNFYKGFRIAYDSLKAEGLPIELSVYDTENSTAKTTAIVASGALDSVDLVVGPFYRSNLEIVAKKTKERGTYTVCPVPQSNKILLDNPHVLKVSPSLAAQIEVIADYVYTTFSKEHIVVIDSRAQKDENLLQVMMDTKQRLYGVNMLEDEVSLKLYDVDSMKILSMLKADVQNIFVVPSTDQVFVTELLTKLEKYHDKFQIKVFGLEPWKNYDNISIKMLQDLNVHVTSTFQEDFTRPQLIALAKKFRTKYGKDPEYFSILGYDIGLFFMEEITKKGRYFLSPSQNQALEFAGMRFLMHNPIPQSGYENMAVDILQYENYNLKSVYKK